VDIIRQTTKQPFGKTNPGNIPFLLRKQCWNLDKSYHVIEVFDLMVCERCEELKCYKWFGFYCLGEDSEDAGDDYKGIPPFTA